MSGMVLIIQDDARTSNRVKTYFERGAKAAGIPTPTVEMTCARMCSAALVRASHPESSVPALVYLVVRGRRLIAHTLFGDIGVSSLRQFAGRRSTSTSQEVLMSSGWAIGCPPSGHLLPHPQ